MIIFEDRIEQLINLMPTIEGYKTQFYWGKDGTDLNLFISENKGKSYPLVYLVTSPETSKGNFSEVSRKCKLVLFVQELKVSKLNTYRMLNSYANFLNPMAAYLIEIFDTSSVSRLSDGYKLQRIPNYSESGKNAQIDKLDAIVLDVDLSINDNCLFPLTLSI